MDDPFADDSSESEDDAPVYKRESRGNGRPSSAKTNYMSEHDLWTLLTDIEMQCLCADLTSKEPPSDYQLKVFISGKLEKLVEKGAIPSTQDAINLMEQPERICIKYMRALLDPKVIKQMMKDEFPSRDIKKILEKIKNLCPDEIGEYNKRLILRNRITGGKHNVHKVSPKPAPRPLSDSPKPIPTPRPRVEEPPEDVEDPLAPNRKPDKSKSIIPFPWRKDSDEPENEDIVTLPKKIDKIDMSKIKGSQDLVGREVPFKTTKRQSYIGYQVYAKEGGSKLYLHKDSITFLKKHGYETLPKLIIGKVKEIQTLHAKEGNRYGLNEGDAFGIATIEFSTKKK